MDILKWIMEGHLPLLSALLLGIVVSVCPCTVASNVSALGGISRQNGSSFLRLLFSYLIARSLAYILVGLCLIYFVGSVEFTAELLSWVGRIAGPLFIVVGVFMLDIIHIHGLENKCVLWMNRMLGDHYSVGSAFLLGLLLAFAFCPYSAAIYFGMMIPMACASNFSLLIPIIFAVGAALPILFVAFIIHKGLQKNKGVWINFYRFESVYRKFFAVLFIITGIMFIWEYFID